ncbi:hypothetical protein PROFUN_04143 [Planoprotostelium fungivorum]|uniref:PH domain-containing protein n=1 Tax=Planoprotostelium fungivorum TaxID=1890364 RepID=A0A2P6NJP1_9EUKA|nr:hypothetical protein PROFUN_04143 [Planoprotostelium fungivorum]
MDRDPAPRRFWRGLLASTSRVSNPRLREGAAPESRNMGVTKEDRREAEKAKAVRRTTILELGRTSIDARKPANNPTRADSFSDLNELLHTGDAHLDQQIHRIMELKKEGKLQNSDFERESPTLTSDDSTESYKPNDAPPPREPITVAGTSTFNLLASQEDIGRQTMLKEYEEMMEEKKRDKARARSVSDTLATAALHTEPTMKRKQSIRQKRAEEKAISVEMKRQIYAFADGHNKKELDQLIQQQNKIPVRERSGSLETIPVQPLHRMKAISSEGDMTRMEAEAERLYSPMTRRYLEVNKASHLVGGALSLRDNNQARSSPQQRTPTTSPRGSLRTSLNGITQAIAEQASKEREMREDQGKKKKDKKKEPREQQAHISPKDILYQYASNVVADLDNPGENSPHFYRVQSESDDDSSFMRSTKDESESDEARTVLENKQARSPCGSPRVHPVTTEVNHDISLKFQLTGPGPRTSGNSEIPTPTSVSRTSSYSQQSISSGYTNSSNAMNNTVSSVPAFIPENGYATSSATFNGVTKPRENLFPQPEPAFPGGYTETASDFSTHLAKSANATASAGGYTDTTKPFAAPIVKSFSFGEAPGGYTDTASNIAPAISVKPATPTQGKKSDSYTKKEVVEEEEGEADEDVMAEILSLFNQLATDDQLDAGVELSEIFPGSIHRLRAGLRERVRRAKALHPSNEVDEKSWNQQFQQILENLNLCDDAQERSTIYSQLSNLAQDFVHYAKTYGKLIISELYLPDDQKTIKPNDIGGFAGGVKYVVKGILFKLAVDSHGLYGSDMAAAKVAGNDLKGLVQYFNLGISRLHFPLMALVDYMGFRIQALSLLPINSDTIIYGTANGGRTVFDKNLKFNAKMRLAGKKLGLSPHTVGLYPKTSKTLYSCADMEGHDGKDGRFYLIDFARSFPPIDFTNGKIKNSHLFRLFRPEFVKKYKPALCPDTFSGFILAHNPQKYIGEVKEATIHLHSETIANCIAELNEVSTEAAIKSINIKQMLHKKGINLMFLGLIRHLTTSNVVRKWLLLEMIGRVAKQEINLRLREKMKELKLALKEPYKSVVVDYLNVLFGHSDHATEYWNKTLKTQIQYYFQDSLLVEEEEETFDLRTFFQGNTMCELFTYVQKLSGLKFNPMSAREFIENPTSFHFKKPFDSTDIEEIGDKVKHMNIVAVSMGFYLSDKASIKMGANSRRLFHLAVEKFEEALYSVPDDKMSLRELARVKAILGDRVTAQKYFLEAIEADASDPVTNFRYAVFLEESNQASLAEEFYLKCLEVEPNDGQVLIRYADFLSRQGKTEDSQKFYALARRINKISSTKEEEIFENERRLPFSREYSKNNLLPSDERGGWSTRSGTPKSKEIKISNHWEWITDWFIDRERWCDPDGWEYAFHWNNEWHSTSSHKSYVRRRKWKRVRRLKNDGRDQFKETLTLDDVAAHIKSEGSGLFLDERKYNGKIVTKCFTGAEAVQWLMKNYNFSQVGAVAFANRMLQNNLVQNTGGSAEPFQDGFVVYRLNDVEKRTPVRGHRKTKSEIKMTEFDHIKKSGYLEKQGFINPMWKKRWFVLQKGSLHFYKRPRDEAARGTISLVNATVHAMKYPSDTLHYLTVKTSARTCLLKAESPAEREEWIKAIESCCMFKSSVGEVEAPKDLFHCICIRLPLDHVNSHESKQYEYRYWVTLVCDSRSQEFPNKMTSTSGTTRGNPERKLREECTSSTATEQSKTIEVFAVFSRAPGNSGFSTEHMVNLCFSSSAKKNLSTVLPLVDLKEVVPVFPPTGGIIFRLRGTKPLDLVDSRKNGRIHLGGDGFWPTLKDVFGRTVVNTAKLTMHPFTVTKENLDLTALEMGSTEFVTEMHLGTVTGNTAAKFKQRTVYKKMNKMVEQGDPIMTLTIRYKSGRSSQDVTLLQFGVRISELLRAESQKKPLKLEVITDDHTTDTEESTSSDPPEDLPSISHSVFTQSAPSLLENSKQQIPDTGQTSWQDEKHHGIERGRQNCIEHIVDSTQTQHHEHE